MLHFLQILGSFFPQGCDSISEFKPKKSKSIYAQLLKMNSCFIFITLCSICNINVIRSELLLQFMKKRILLFIKLLKS